MDRKKILIIRNPRAGRSSRRLVDQVVVELGKLGAVAHVHDATGEKNSEALARNAAQKPSEFDLVVVAGGDGTINKVAAGLYGSEIPLGVIPAGSANVLIRDLGLTPRISLAAVPIAQALVSNPTRPLYLCEARTSSGAHPFVAMASVGFDARSVANVSLVLKARIGRAAYAIASLRELLRRKPTRVTVKWSGGTCEADWVIAAKTRHYAGPFVLDRAIDISDPDMTVFAIQSEGFASLIGHLAALKQGRLSDRKGVRIIRADHLEIYGETVEPVQVDGDFTGHSPVTLKVSKKPLKVVVF